MNRLIIYLDHWLPNGSSRLPSNLDVPPYPESSGHWFT
ncbi:Hypothetical protein I595_3437 [Croceitalea dokdonensis DOKDO 023]|uniref:Uncharacterized protein n=1 Tax=Croceitalea dokdonensis DOKDO 023 TaxID=1300341 RepID=A0A0P7ARF6_9FLAO|nr:Hypothetical protein I595_3437 [Croceitalea dokdonensis DOKDO 023]